MELQGKQKDFINLVKTGEPYILVEAPAGTGKTFCCIQAARQIWLNRMIYDYQKVLVLTFSRNARAQIMRELMKVPDEERIAKHIEINNYHSFFKKYLDAYRDLIGILEPLTVMDNDAYDESLLEYSNERGLLLPKKIGCESLDDFFIDEQNITCVNPKSKCRNRAAQEIEQYHAAALQFTQQTGVVAFSQFANLMCYTLSQSPSIAKAISHDYPVVILDEYQDTNYYQEKFVKAIIPFSKCIFFADSFQMIYEFRGSNANRISDLSHQFSTLKRIEFDEYHRYKDRPDLVAILTAIRKGLPVDYASLLNGTMIFCSAPCDPHWENIKGPSRLAQCTILCKFIYYSIIKKVSSALNNSKSVAVLCRTNTVANRLAEVFFQNHLHPRAVSDTPDMLKLTKLLKKAIDDTMDVSAKIPSILGIAALCTTNRTLAGEGYDELTNLSAQGLSRKRKPLLKEIYLLITPFMKATSLNDIGIVLNMVLSHMQLKDDVSINYPRKRFVEHCLNTQGLSAQKIDSIMLQRQYIDSFTGIGPGLYVTTIHQSKGKEFDSVFIIDVDSLVDDANLLYVSHSRMREELYPIRIQYTGFKYRKE